MIPGSLPTARPPQPPQPPQPAHPPHAPAAIAPSGECVAPVRPPSSPLYPPRDKAARRLWDTLAKFRKQNGRRQAELVLPPESGYMRACAHDFAERLGLVHTSKGIGHERSVMITFPPTPAGSQTTSRSAVVSTVTARADALAPDDLTEASRKRKADGGMEGCEGGSHADSLADPLADSLASGVSDAHTADGAAAAATTDGIAAAAVTVAPPPSASRSVAKGCGLLNKTIKELRLCAKNSDPHRAFTLFKTLEENQVFFVKPLSLFFPISPPACHTPILPIDRRMYFSSESWESLTLFPLLSPTCHTCPCFPLSMSLFSFCIYESDVLSQFDTPISSRADRVNAR